MIDPQHLTQVIFREDSIITICVDGESKLLPNLARLEGSLSLAVGANCLRGIIFLAKNEQGI